MVYSSTRETHPFPLKKDTYVPHSCRKPSTPPPPKKDKKTGHLPFCSAGNPSTSPKRTLKGSPTKIDKKKELVPCFYPLESGAPSGGPETHQFGCRGNGLPGLSQEHELLEGPPRRRLLGAPAGRSPASPRRAAARGFNGICLGGPARHGAIFVFLLGPLSC